MTRDIILRSLPTRPPEQEASRRCRVARDRGCGSQFRGEIGNLLLGRLRIVSLITLAPLSLFFILNLLEKHHQERVALADLLLQGSAMVFIAALAGMVWLYNCFSLAALRRLELTLFGVL